MTQSRTQADVVVRKFGGANRLAKLLGVEPSTVYRWTYAKADGGTDGVIPGRRLRQVLALAPLQHPPVVITAADLYPVEQA